MFCPPIYLSTLDDSLPVHTHSRYTKMDALMIKAPKYRGSYVYDSMNKIKEIISRALLYQCSNIRHSVLQAYLSGFKYSFNNDPDKRHTVLGAFVYSSWKHLGA